VTGRLAAAAAAAAVAAADDDVIARKQSRHEDVFDDSVFSLYT